MVVLGAGEYVRPSTFLANQPVLVCVCECVCSLVVTCKVLSDWTELTLRLLFLSSLGGVGKSCLTGEWSPRRVHVYRGQPK